VTDNLRDRIAAVVSLNVDSDQDYLAVADAVIEALGLTSVNRSEREPKHRYVTEWETDKPTRAPRDLRAGE
jgi:hypothetical protein